METFIVKHPEGGPLTGACRSPALRTQCDAEPDAAAFWKSPAETMDAIVIAPKLVAVVTI